MSCGGSDDSPSTPSTQPEISCDIIEHGNSSAASLVESEELQALEQVYSDFETFVRDKNETGLNSIFLHGAMPLYISGKRTSGIENLAFTGAEFINNIRGRDGLELRISQTDFSIFKGAAWAWANFDEVENNAPISTGIDLFFFMNTTEGWKLTATNNTFTLDGDNTDYTVTQPMSTEPETTINNMVTTFNQLDRTGFLGTFRSGAPLIVVSGQMTSDYNASQDTPSAFFNCASASSNALTLSLSDLSIEVQDQYLAAASGNYTFAIEGETIESGEAVFTLIGTPNGGWRISAGAFTY